MPAGAKRKRNATEQGSAPEKTSEELKELKALEDQYYQGLDMSKIGPGLGCGECLLKTPLLTFQSPVMGLMSIEIMSGTRGPGTGGFRFSARDETSTTFLVPFQHVEQVLILDEPGPDDTEESTSGYRVIVVPTAFVGASALKKTLPKVISFTLPDGGIGSEFEGTVGEAADASKEAFRSLLTRAFNEQLAPFDKSVVDVSSAGDVKKRDAPITCDATLKPTLTEEDEQPAKGRLFFLEPGILFWSQSTSRILYLTHDSIPGVMLIFNHDKSQHLKTGNLSLICRATEPYYEKGQKNGRSTRQSASKQSEEPLLLSFHAIRTSLSDKISQYAKKHEIKLQELEQEWYDLKKGEPATGWMPRGMLSGMRGVFPNMAR
ncbi:hypothetical protein Daus18300_007609 [Diaporthe australafricana]|uniref:Uncharacterized protein n=1 Tax=Diaporthe australafricana TaxID=127596 RepID=A0ABR3WM77_9PEZI